MQQGARGVFPFFTHNHGRIDTPFHKTDFLGDPFLTEEFVLSTLIGQCGTGWKHRRARLKNEF